MAFNGFFVAFRVRGRILREKIPRKTGKGNRYIMFLVKREIEERGKGKEERNGVLQEA